jgi:hypothetical protein
MIILADSKRIIAAVALFASSALFGPQTQFQGSVPTGGFSHSRRAGYFTSNQSGSAFCSFL